MPQQRPGYRATPANPNTPAAPRPAQSAIEDLDGFFDDLDQCLEEIEVLRAHIQKPGD
jgi:hypothetical protein